jgi:hypothetical protein
MIRKETFGDENERKGRSRGSRFRASRGENSAMVAIYEEAAATLARTLQHCRQMTVPGLIVTGCFETYQTGRSLDLGTKLIKCFIYSALIIVSGY